jgi:hypothetical protein
MADEWYCEIAGREIGPLSSQQLRAMAAKGQIVPNDRVRHGGQGSWISAKTVKGLFPESPSAVAKTPPAASSPAARPLPPQPPVPPPPPTTLPRRPDAGDGDSFDFLDDSPSSDFGGRVGNELTVYLHGKRRQRQQQLAVGLLVAAIVGLGIAGLLLALASSSRPGPSQPSAKKGHAVQEEPESPEALEAKEGVESVEAKKPKLRKAVSEEPAKKPAAPSNKPEKMPGKAAATNAKRTDASKVKDSQETEPKKSREARPGTPEGDFGLPEVDPSI